MDTQNTNSNQPVKKSKRNNTIIIIVLVAAICTPVFLCKLSSMLPSHKKSNEVISKDTAKEKTKVEFIKTDKEKTKSEKNWQEQFIKESESNNKYMQLFIEQSLLSIAIHDYNENILSDCKICAREFQRLYSKEHGKFSHTSTIIFYCNRKVKTFNCSDNGIEVE